MKMAVTMFAACALKPPMLPATAEPIRFLEIFTSTRACTVVLRTELTTSAGTTASQTTDLPRPSILQHNGFVYKTGSWDGLKANFGPGSQCKLIIYSSILICHFQNRTFPSLYLISLFMLI